VATSLNEVVNMITVGLQELADSEFIPVSQENSEKQTDDDSVSESYHIEQKCDDHEPRDVDQICHDSDKHNNLLPQNDDQTRYDMHENSLSESSEQLIINSMTESLRNVSIDINVI